MIPVLPRGVRLHWDRVREIQVLLGPERALMLDQIGYEILSRVDGKASATDICSDLADTFGAPVEQVTSDVEAFLKDLSDRRLVDVIP